MTQRVQLDFQEEALQGVLNQMRSGHSSLDGLASQFSMHRRTLNRRLQACDTIFRALENQAPHEIACELHSGTTRSAEAIAAELGYTSASAFSRAFAKWEGQPPDAWRRQARLPPNT